MKTFIKANVASLVASCYDYALTIMMVHFLLADPFFAGISGNIFGGIVNFTIGKFWVFQDQTNPVNVQVKRYLLTWTGNLVLNIIGLYILIKLLGTPYLIAKFAISIVVAVAYNYPLQKRYVYK